MRTTIFQIILIPILIVINAFFVAAEMALARVRRTRIDQLAAEGNRAALLVQRSLDAPDKFISACQLGITLATLALGMVSGEAFVERLVSAVVPPGGEATHHLSLALISTIKFVFFVLAFTFMAFLQTIFGELLPKTVTFQRAEPIVLALIWPMEAWMWCTSWVLRALNGTTSVILHVFNIKEPPKGHFAHTEAELRMLVSASHEEGVLEEEEEEMLHSVFDFSDTVVNQVMTPRTEMVCIAAESTIRTFVDLALKHGHSRLPIYEEDIDNIFGMVHIRDGLRALIEHKENSKVRELSRKVLIVPENKNAGDLLTEFKKTKTHMAIVIDEYGATRGLVTIEDLLEELVGDIADEHEVVEEYVQMCEDGSALLDAKIDLYELNERLHLNIEDEEFNTLGGHVFGLLGREPRVGDEVGTERYTLRVEEADRHRIQKIRLIYTPLVKEVAQPAASDLNGRPNGNGEPGHAGEPSSKSLEPMK